MIPDSLKNTFETVRFNGLLEKLKTRVSGLIQLHCGAVFNSRNRRRGKPSRDYSSEPVGATEPLGRQNYPVDRPQQW